MQLSLGCIPFFLFDVLKHMFIKFSLLLAWGSYCTLLKQSESTHTFLIAIAVVVVAQNQLFVHM